ncbi:hypothetical protein A3Q56_04273 [Intoshia linei]|uniref:Uncharacterized protein n=1 Tax=Intoshia linei TaxID=1819745 RepID=A0A177B3K8_9BILA|nr:hypothetical protein A3Q56_04273 [Intoshia linei]
MMMHFTTNIRFKDLIRYGGILGSGVQMLSTVSHISPNLGKIMEKVDSKSNTEPKESLAESDSNLMSTFSQVFYFHTSLAGMFGSPVYNYREYLQLIKPSRIYISFKNIFKIIVYVVSANVIYKYVGSIDDKFKILNNNVSLKESFLQLILYSSLLSLYFQLIITTSCIFSEIVINASGIPTNKSNQTTWIHGMDFCNLSCKNSLRTMMRAWNMSIQLWIYRCFYLKFNLNKINKSYALALVIIFNVLWHGFYMMYAVAAFIFVACVCIQDYIISTFILYERHFTKDSTHINGHSDLKYMFECIQGVRIGRFGVNLFFNIFMWILTHLTMHFLFICISTDNNTIIWNFWKCLYFYPIFIWIFLYIITKFITIIYPIINKSQCEIH